MPQRCTACQTELGDSVKFCTNCGSKDLATSVSAGSGFASLNAAKPSPEPTAASASSSSSTFTATLPNAAPLPVNTNKIPMDAREFSDFLGSISRGLMKDADQIKKIKAATSSSYFTCAQVIEVANHVKGHPGEAIVTLYPAIVDASPEAFAKVLASLKWVEERQEVLTNLKLDSAPYAAVLKK